MLTIVTDSIARQSEVAIEPEEEHYCPRFVEVVGDINNFSVDHVSMV